MKGNMLISSLLLLGVLNVSCQNTMKPIQIKGSDTLVNLVQVLAENYMEREGNVAIAVTGGGSGVGIAAFTNGTADIANHSRPMKEKELKACEEEGVVPTTVVIGIDGLSFIVNDSNPIDSLSVEDIGRIYRGEVDSWKQVGGQYADISFYGRQPNSGTYDFVQELVLGNKDYSPKMKQMNGNAQIVEAVKIDINSIGYVGVGYVFDEQGNIHKGINVLKVSAGDGPAYSPTNIDNVTSGRYPISRPMFQTVNGSPKEPVKDFIAFELDPEGQEIVKDLGFFPVGGVYIEANKKVGF